MNFRKIEILLLSLLGIALTGALIYFMAGTNWTGWSFDFNFSSNNDKMETKNLSFDAQSFSTLDIEVVSADVTVIGTDSDQVEVTLMGSAMDRLKAEQTGNRLVIKEKSCFGFCSGNLSVEVKVPKAMLEELDVNTVSGRTQIDQISAPQMKVDTVSGRIDLKDVQFDEFNSDSVSGSLNASILGEFDKIDCQSVSGSFDLTLRDVTCVDVRFDSLSGNEKNSLSSCTQHRIDVDSVSGSLEINQ